jgi:integrase
MRLLRELRLQQRCSGDDDFVFAKINGDWQNSETLRQAFKRACRRAEIPVLLWSDMRHYFASSQINELGEAWNNIADDMGHHSADFTRTQYRHYLDNSEKQETTRTIARKSIYGSD